MILIFSKKIFSTNSIYFSGIPLIYSLIRRFYFNLLFVSHLDPSTTMLADSSSIRKRINQIDLFLQLILSVDQFLGRSSFPWFRQNKIDFFKSPIRYMLVTDIYEVFVNDVFILCIRRQPDPLSAFTFNSNEVNQLFFLSFHLFYDQMKFNSMP